MPGENEAGPSSAVDKPITPSDEEDLLAFTDVETRKGVPGSIPTFPNGLRDVHEMSAAAEALTSINHEEIRLAERSGEYSFLDGG